MATPKMHETLQHWLDLLERRHPVSIDLGLDRCGRVYSALGSPRPARHIITVAGTNGKGSVVAWLSALLAAQGRSVAAFTSPHIHRFNERLLVNGAMVSDGELVGAFETVEEARGGESLTYFEFTTLACFHLMAQADPDHAVLEVGLGGRLDTVNLVDADVAVITAVDLDHQSFLGDDRETIGREKAGILRAGRPLVCGETHPPESVRDRAREMGCDVWLPGRDYQGGIHRGRYWFRMGERDIELPLPPLVGAHQVDNLAAALAAFFLACPDASSDDTALGAAISKVVLNGRLQSWAGDPRVLLDVGHNPLAARAIRRYLYGRSERCHCVLAMLADKDAEGVVEALSDRVEHWYCAGLEGDRGQTGRELSRRVRNVMADERVQVFVRVEAALQTALARAGADDTVLVFGSFLTVAEALRWLEAASASPVVCSSGASLPETC